MTLLEHEKNMVELFKEKGVTESETHQLNEFISVEVKVVLEALLNKSSWRENSTG